MCILKLNVLISTNHLKWVWNKILKQDNQRMQGLPLEGHWACPEQLCCPWNGENFNQKAVVDGKTDGQSLLLVTRSPYGNFWLPVGDKNKFSLYMETKSHVSIFGRWYLGKPFDLQPSYLVQEGQVNKLYKFNKFEWPWTIGSRSIFGR